MSSNTASRASTAKNSIDNDSVYREEARSAHDGLRDEYVGKVDTKAKEYAKANKCGALRKLRERAGEIWTEAGEVAATHESGCQTRVAVKPKTPKKPRDPKPKDPKPKDPPPDTSGKSASELTNEARVAAKSGQFGKAIRLCEQALAKKRGDQDAAMVCVIAACNLKNAAKAKRYINKLRSAGRKGMARQICLKQGVKVD
jgi:hypothetical protein